MYCFEFSACFFLHLLLNLENFAEAPAKVDPPVMSEPAQEEEAIPPMIYLMLLGLVHQRVIQQQAATGDLPVATVEMESHSPARTVLEQGGDKPEPETEMSLILPAPSRPSASDLVEVTEASSSMLSVG